MDKKYKAIKCPFCGATDRITTLGKYFKCGYCGSTFHLNSDDEEETLHEARHYMARYKFDDADDLYRALGKKAMNNENYDLYRTCEWGRLLAYFGVVYVKSFSGNISIPTIVKYDSRFDSIRKSEHYYNILDTNPDAAEREKYEVMAKTLDETYTKISEELAKTPEYDVFLCAKISLATEAHPDLEGFTKDSKLADTLYYELKDRGLSVFYSDKSCQGIEYDAQILSALSRSKMLLVISTKKEYLESVWVESEWRRWLNFMKWEEKSKDSLILYIPNYHQNFELPTVLEHRKTQYFDNSITVINHIVKTLDKLHMPKKEEENKKLLDSLLQQIEELKQTQQNLSESDKVNYQKAIRFYNSGNYIESIDLFLPLAKKDNREACYFLAKMHSNPNKKITYDLDEAFKWFKKAAMLKSREALYELAFFYKEGLGSCQQDLNEAFKLITESAKLKEPNAMCELGHYYHDGIGTPINLEEAFKWYQMASSEGNVRANYDLGYAYQNGEGCKVNKKEAFSYYQKAAFAGNSNAQYTLGQASLKGNEYIKANEDDAVSWLLKAAFNAEPNSVACEVLGNYYENHHDRQNALKSYLKGSQLGNHICSYEVGKLYYLEDNYRMALTYLEMANEKLPENSNKHLKVQYFLAKTYLKLSKNPEELENAFKTLLELSQFKEFQDDSYLFFELGGCFEAGLGVSEDKSKALEYYKVSLKKGNPFAASKVSLIEEALRNLEVQELTKNEDAKNSLHPIKKKPKQTHEKEETNGKEYNEQGAMAFKKGDYARAVKFYEKAIQVKNAAAYFNLGLCYERGLGVKRDLAKAFTNYLKGANLGNDNAQCNVGYYYELGYGTVVNFKEAFKWYTRSAKNGNARAKCFLGALHQNGRGTKKDLEKAFELYLEAADDQNGLACYYVGSFYENGLLEPVNLSEAFKWYLIGSKLGNSLSQYNLAICYEIGKGCTKNINEAFQWLEKSAKAGYGVAMDILGTYYEYGRGCQKDLKTALKWYQESAKRGVPGGMCNLGNCYELGKIVEKNLTTAFKLYLKSAELGNSNAQCNVGNFYENGYGTLRNIYEAVKWYKKSAAQGNLRAITNLGVCYEKGMGVRQSDEEAFDLYLKAAMSGYARAQCMVGFCYEEGFVVVENPFEAKKWYEKSALQGYVSAQYNLGLCYEFGRGTVKNLAEAKKYYNLAALQNYPKAVAKLKTLK